MEGKTVFSVYCEDKTRRICCRSQRGLGEGSGGGGGWSIARVKDLSGTARWRKSLPRDKGNSGEGAGLSGIHSSVWDH